jgi:hypothetical protein
MANIYYVFRIRDSSITSGENRKTGLSPSWVFLKRLTDGTTITPPAISEIASGQYKFVFDAEANGECSGQIDAGSTLSNYSDRFIDWELTRDSSRIQTALSAVGVVNLPTPAPPGYNSAGSGPIAVNQNTGGVDNLRYVNFQGQGVAGATILIYQSTDWPGNPANVVATATTGPDGRWTAPAYVTSGTYVAVFTKVGADGPNVSAPFTV